MLKKEEIANPESCLNRAEEDEPVFVLLARDAAAAEAVRLWALRRVALGKNEAGDAQITEAYELAGRMEAWAKARQKS